jgi:pyrroloquinoline quinone biosynthesis protein E
VKQLIKLYSAGLELTMACPCRCETCGSDAGRARAGELTTGEWVDVIRSLGDLGCGRLTFLGGEPLLARDWPVLVRTARDAGIYPDLITSGVTVDADLAQRLAGSGLVSSNRGAPPFLSRCR